MRGSGWKRDSRPFSTQIKNFSLSRRAIFCQFEFKLSAGEGRSEGLTLSAALHPNECGAKFRKRQDLYLGSFKVVSQRKYALAGREMRGPGWNGPLSLRMFSAEAAATHSTLVKTYSLSRQAIS